MPENKPLRATKSWADTPEFRPFEYFVALLSILPVIGAAIGLAAIIWGLLTRNRGGNVIAIIGALGLSSQALLFVFIFHFLLQPA